MPVAVLFAGGWATEHQTGIRSALESIPSPSHEIWEIVLQNPEPESIWTMTINGPDCHRRVLRMSPTDPRPRQPDYLAGLVRIEIASFPSFPPQDLLLAVAELTLQKVPLDLDEAFSGHITVDGVRTDSHALIDLYRERKLDREALRRRLA